MATRDACRVPAQLRDLPGFLVSRSDVRRAPRQRTLAFVLAAGMLVGAVGASLPSGDAQAQQVGVDQLRFCRDANGERLRGDIDILLLLDDTLTLRRQDPRDARFGVIRSFLEGVTQIPTEQQVNFATYTFGEGVTPVLDFEAITSADLQRIDRVIRDNNPAQQMETNFVIAMNRASQALNARPAQNCRILLWFTDGNHDERDDFSSQADVRESENLRNEFCAADGIADRVRAQRINTFVLLLEPPPSQPMRLEASKDVFQVLTGDPNPNFPDEERPGRRPTANCDRPLGEQLGKVFAVDEAEKLVAIIADFLNEIEDGGRITEELCPYPDGSLDSLALPDAHLIDWLSVTDFARGGDDPSPDASLLRILTADGDEYAGEEVLERFREAGPSARFRIRAEFLDELGAGWIVRAERAENLCLRSRAVDLTFSLSSADPGLAVIAPEALPDRLWVDDRLAYFAPDGGQLSTDEALRSPEVRGRLRVDSVDALSSDGTLPARIVIDGAPVRSDQCSVIQIPAALTVSGGLFASRPEAPQAPLVSSECTLTPATRGGDGGTLDFTATLVGLDELREDDQCDVGDDWHVLIDGQRITGTTQQLTAGGDAVRFAIASGAEPANAARDCIARALPPVEFVWQGQTILVPASVTAEWERRGDVAIASGFTVFALALALFLSYGLLLLMNWGLLRPPAGKSLRSFSVEATLHLTSRGDARLVWSDRQAGDVTDPVRPGAGGGSKPLSFRGDAFTLSRRLRANPLKEPTLVMQRGDQRVTVVSEPRVGPDIPINFPDLSLLWTASAVPATADQEVAVTFTVVHSNNKTSPTKDFERLRERAPQLAMRLQQKLVAAAPKNTKAGSRDASAGGRNANGLTATRRRSPEEKDATTGKLRKRTSPKPGSVPGRTGSPGAAGLRSEPPSGASEGNRPSDGTSTQKRRRED